MGGEESQEKTEEATPRKLRDARKKGQVAKSRDLNSVLLLLIAFLTLAFMNSTIAAKLREFMITCFEQVGKSGERPPREMMFPLLNESLRVMTLAIMPLAVIVFVVAAFVSFIQVGAVFSIEPIKPNLKKINPIDGFKNLFKLRQFVELIKSALKIILVFLIAYFVLKSYLRDLIISVSVGLQPTLILAGKIIASFVIKVAIFFLAIALFDLLYQRWQYGKDLRMSKYEVMQEFKRDEGDPHIKQHRRQMHQELSNMDMAKVAKSDVVVVNPIHLAIAVQYDRRFMNAPQIAVKGQRLLAEQIKNLARENDIPIVENVPLAHALFELDAGDEIPEALYEAMAEVLSFVYRVKGKRVEAESAT